MKHKITLELIIDSEDRAKIHHVFVNGHELRASEETGTEADSVCHKCWAIGGITESESCYSTVKLIEVRINK